ncbi:MAG: 16S rRNA (adenine(1518)-N(6)/adenine(1519)-N(6))-dimethyltransferase RsmA [Verrucomicrobiota bacterium]
MNLSQLRAALAAARVQPVKTLGQNFLHDQNLARWIVDQAQIEANDFVVEIGPGLGALTEEIVARGARVLALEKDGRLATALRERFAGAPVEVRHGDALEFDARQLFGERNVRVIGCLPYYIASQLLTKFVTYPFSNKLSLFMLQDEMARRISSVSGTADYGALTVRLQAHHEVAYLRKIPPPVFFPRPEVDSAVVRITPRAEAEVAMIDGARLRELVRLGFSQRRKQVRNVIGDSLPAWEHLAAKLAFKVTARAGEISREQWIALAQAAAGRSGKLQSQNDAEMFPLVDENDVEVAAAPRREVHENNLRHRAVHLLIFNKKGELLLQKRSAGKDRHPLVWDSSAAGHVNAGEEYESAATRELEEELGITTPLTPIGKLGASEATGQEFINVYRGTHEGPFHFPLEEISAVEFFPISLIERWTTAKPEEFAPGFLECWRLWHTTETPPAA